ncbi:MAG: YcgJ family protein [Candidatus Competibacteraceae bacterium]
MMMKFSSLFVGASLLLASVGATPALADNFRPERGVRCDESARVCYERGIPSVGMTRRYFGHRAAKRLARDLRREERRYGARTFYPERGVRCDEFARVCYERGIPSVEMTENYFGHHAARRLARDLRREERRYGARTFYPERGVRCDRAVQVCYNRHGEPSFEIGWWLGLSPRNRQHLRARPGTTVRSGHERLRAGWPLPLQQRGQEPPAATAAARAERPTGRSEARWREVAKAFRLQ